MEVVDNSEYVRYPSTDIGEARQFQDNYPGWDDEDLLGPSDVQEHEQIMAQLGFDPRSGDGLIV